MTRTIATLTALVVLVAGCSRSGKMQRDQQQYQTVQEGSASGVTSTINGPGETPVRTDTNVDTTTNLTILTNPNPLGNDTVGTAFAGSSPSAVTSIAGVSTPSLRRPTQPRTETSGMASASAPLVTETIATTTQPMPKVGRTTTRSPGDATTTMSTSEPAPETSPTSTSTETDQKPLEAKKKKVNDGEKSEDPQPPPPPPPTDTFGPRR